jgi:hypothetical protein
MRMRQWMDKVSKMRMHNGMKWNVPDCIYCPTVRMTHFGAGDPLSIRLTLSFASSLILHFSLSFISKQQPIHPLPSFQHPFSLLSFLQIICLTFLSEYVEWLYIPQLRHWCVKSDNICNIVNVLTWIVGVNILNVNGGVIVRLFESE